MLNLNVRTLVNAKNSGIYFQGYLKALSEQEGVYTIVLKMTGANAADGPTCFKFFNDHRAWLDTIKCVESDLRQAGFDIFMNNTYEDLVIQYESVEDFVLANRLNAFEEAFDFTKVPRKTTIIATSKHPASSPEFILPDSVEKQIFHYPVKQEEYTSAFGSDMEVILSHIADKSFVLAGPCCVETISDDEGGPYDEIGAMNWRTNDVLVCDLTGVERISFYVEILGKKSIGSTKVISLVAAEHPSRLSTIADQLIRIFTAPEE